MSTGHYTPESANSLAADIVGKTITGVRIDPDTGGIGLVLDDEVLAWVDRDPEGNGPGWIALDEAYPA